MLLESNQIAVSRRIIFIPICKYGFCGVEGLSTRSEIIYKKKKTIPPPLFTPTPCQLSSSVHFTPWLQGQNDYELGLAQNRRIWRFSKYFTVRWRLKFLEEIRKMHKGKEVADKKKKATKNPMKCNRKWDFLTLSFRQTVSWIVLCALPFYLLSVMSSCILRSSLLPFYLGECSCTFKLIHT